MKARIIIAVASLAALLGPGAPAPTATPGAPAQEEGATAEGQIKGSSEVARELSSREPYRRRRAAEELAARAAVDQRKLLEGFRLQEKDARVRLALDWALYRAGKNETLFSLVGALDSKNAEQALAYLKGLEGPEPLYVFLPRVNGRTQIRLLELLAGVGDAATLEQLKPYTASLDPGISDAAKFAEREITIRLEEAPAAEPKRKRQVGESAETEP